MTSSRRVRTPAIERAAPPGTAEQRPRPASRRAAWHAACGGRRRTAATCIPSPQGADPSGELGNGEAGRSDSQSEGSREDGVAPIWEGRGSFSRKPSGRKATSTQSNMVVNRSATAARRATISEDSSITTA
jgi:hypothetical protein